MISLKAASPVCNCKNPDTCIHMFSLKIGERSFTYKQADFISSVDVIDEGAKGIPLSLTLLDKGCVSKNNACPRGVIYNLEDSKSIYVFHKGLATYKVHFDEKKTNFFKSKDSIDFLVDYVMTKDVRDMLPKDDYVLQVGECKGYPFISKPLNFMDGVSHVLNMPPRDVLWTSINVFPSFSWETGLTIGYEREVEKYSSEELRKQQKEDNAAQGKSQRGHRGWTKRPEYNITDKLEAEGKLTCKLGSISHDYSATLKQEFKRKARALTLLSKASEAIDVITKAFSTNEGDNEKINLLTTEIKYPEIEIKGSGELKEDDDTTTLYMERKVSFGMAPFIGVSITLDLMQAFAAWYGQEMVLAAVRERLKAGEDNYDKGDNAAFADGKLHLIVEGDINLSLDYISDAKNEWEWHYDENTEAKLSLTLDANFRAGVRYYVVNGAIEIGGKTVAEGCIGLEKNHRDPNKIDAVIYHNGVTAKVYVSYTYGGSSSSEHGIDDDDDVVVKSEVKFKSEDNVWKEWVIHEKLEKEKSDFRIHLF
ncbi:hypothetical protein M942_24290 [Enterobacter ludwigii]|uniref:hypothetical protein n=1 Tax=Enterobacter ludwigii TaxID=299767 RepID=UPI0003D7DA92|nr:hypothetical protein [Enterobacter ludwigii]AHE73527.1 hypothetical protein M942_24290 [Enterobacter ludwigii]